MSLTPLCIQTGFSKITMRNLLHWVPWLSFLLCMTKPATTPMPWEKKQYSHVHNKETEAEPLVAAKQVGCNAAGVLQAHDNHFSCQNYLHLHRKTITSSSPWQSDGSSAGQFQQQKKADLPLKSWQLVRHAGHQEGSEMLANNKHLSVQKMI